MKKKESMFQIGDQVWFAERQVRGEIIDLEKSNEGTRYFFIEYPSPINAERMYEPVYGATESQLKKFEIGDIPESKIENNQYPEYVRCPLVDYDMISSGSCVVCSDIAGNIIKDRCISKLFSRKSNWKEICQNCRWFGN